MKVAFHKFLLISLLEQKPKCKGLVLIRLLRLPWLQKWPPKKAETRKMTILEQTGDM